MQVLMFEYKVVPAPEKGEKARGLKTPEARFAATLQTLMNDLGADGWEYVRADTLPSTERSGLRQATTVWRHLLIFRRPLAGTVAAISPQTHPAMQPDKRHALVVSETAAASHQQPGMTDSAPTPRPTSGQGATDEATAAQSPREDPEIVEPVRKLFAHRSDEGSRPTPPLRAPEDRGPSGGPEWDDRSGS